MKHFFTPRLLCIIILLFSNRLFAQLPTCIGDSGFVYVHTSTNSISNWNPFQPLSGTNPVANTIPMLSTGIGLAVSSNINGVGPSPTFYTTSGGNYWYYNGTTWANTGHSVGNSAAVNPGAGGGFIYNLVGSTGQVYKYDGTANGTLLVTINDFTSGGPYDIVADCVGNFYVLRCQTPAWLRKYSPAGTLMQQWDVIGAPNTPSGGGFGIVGNTLQLYNSSLYMGLIGATSVTVSAVTGAFPSPGDFGSCPIGGEYKGKNDTLFNCSATTGAEVISGGNPPYSYNVISGSATVTGNGPNFNVLSTTAATVVTYGTANALCTAGGIAADTFLVIPVPTINAGTDDTLYGCAAYLDTLHGVLGNTTSWINYTLAWSPSAVISSGANTLNPVIQPTENTTFTLTVTTDATQGDCSRSDSVRISVKDESVTPDYDFEIKYGCNADTVLFTNTSLQATASLWDFVDGSMPDTTTNPVHVYPNQDIYYVKLVASNYMCIDSVIKIIDTRHPLIAGFTVEQDTICQNNTVTFSNNSTISVQPGTYFWNFGDGGTSTAMNPTHYYTLSGSHNVMLVVTDAVPCTDTFYYTVVVDSIPSLDFSVSDHAICTGESVNFIAEYTSSGNAGLTWNFGDNNLAYNIDTVNHAYEEAGMFPIRLTAHYRVCDDITETDSVMVYPFPNVNLGPDTVLCLQGNPLYISNLIAQEPGQRFKWSTGDTTETLKIVHDGTYSLSVSTAFDCTTTDDIIVSKDCYTDIPNSFTPNGDGSNDYFFPRQFLSKSVTSFSMKVYNRYGQMIFETTNPNGRGWDGKFNSKDQPTGVYVYTIDVTFDNNKVESFSGNVTLLR